MCVLIDEAASLGIDTFVLDDGWFGTRNDETSGLGDWFVNESKLTGGLSLLIKHCEERGLRFGLWIEPEMVNENSDFYRAHPDYIIHREGIEPAQRRNQFVLDFTRKEVVDAVYTALSGILRRYNISYIKWDMNRNITEFYSPSLPSHRQGELTHRYILGVYDLANRLTTEFPHVFFEGCAAGGGRFDAGMLFYFAQIWTSDVTDAYDRARIQYGTSVCYPVSSMSCHVSVCPNHQTGRSLSLFTRGSVASLGATGYELDLTKLSQKEKEEVRSQIASYKKIDELVLHGDLYRLRNPLHHRWFCEMIVSKDKTCAYVVGERILSRAWDYDEYICLYGLDENKIYHIKELNVTMSGSALINAGILMPRLHDFSAWTWHIQSL